MSQSKSKLIKTLLAVTKEAEEMEGGMGKRAENENLPGTSNQVPSG